MYRFKYYVLDKTEHYEIWENDILVKEFSAPFGDGLFALIDSHEAKVDNYIKMIEHYRWLSEKNSWQDHKELLSFQYNFDNNPMFIFVNYILDLYKRNEAEDSVDSEKWYGVSQLKKYIGKSLVFYDDFACNGKIVLSSIDELETLLKLKYEVKGDEIVEALYPENIYDLIYYQLMLTVRLNKTEKLRVSQCKRCGRLFTTFRLKRLALYCNVKNDSGYTCKEENEMAFLGSTDETYVKACKLYQKEYNFKKAWLKYNKITEDEFLRWKEVAKDKLHRCRCGEVTLEDYEKWLSENKRKKSI